jgi:hypothetical protein
MKKLFQFLFLTLPLFSFSQIQIKSLPFFFKNKLKISNYQTFTLDRFDKEYLLLNDKKNIRLKQYSFAKAYDVDLFFDTKLFVNKDSLKIFYKKIIVPQADGISLIFNDYKLLKGEKIFIFDNSQKYLIGALTDINNKESGILPVRFIPKDTIIVEYQRLKTNNNVFPFIKTISAAYRKLDNTSSWCEININCNNDPRWQKIKHSVVKIVFKDDQGGTYVCTGSLIANTKQDDAPYLITANHCINSETEAQNSVFYFNYETPDCNSTVQNDTQTVSGAHLIATVDEHLDFSLLRLSIVPPAVYDPYYVGWDRTKDYNDSSFCIHHPQGDVKKISESYSAPQIASFSGYDSNKHWLIKQWNKGSTEPGSSGAGLFTTDALLIGTLSGGDASCDDNHNDYFQQFYHDWDDYYSEKKQVRCWLDPFLFDPHKMFGYYPYKNLQIPKPQNFNATKIDSTIYISFDEASSPADKYYIYRNLSIIDTLYHSATITDKPINAGVYVYYATAIFSGKESKPSNMKSFVIGDTSRMPKLTEIKIFPNPTSDILYVHTPDSIPMLNIKIINSNGRIIKKYNFNKINHTTLYLSGLKKSIYLIQIKTTGSTYTKKIVIFK